eukprot:5258204-Pyramimonas_sp.AAC.1
MPLASLSLSPSLSECTGCPSSPRRSGRGWDLVLPGTCAYGPKPSASSSMLLERPGARDIPGDARVMSTCVLLDQQFDKLGALSETDRAQR